MTAPCAPFRVRFRKDVQFDGTVLRDLLTGNVYPLNDHARALAKHVDGRLTVDELLALVMGPLAGQRRKTEREIRQMLLLGMFEETCSGARGRLARISGGEKLAPQVLAGSRFGCQNSGACCRGYVFGPISEQEKLRIEALDPRKALPQLGTTPLFLDAGMNSGQPSFQLATTGGACVFLESGPGCGLHRAFGPKGKPVLCQLYPLAVVATIDGLKVYDRGECATFATSARTGSLVAALAPGIRELVDEELYHPVTWAHGSWRCDYGLILDLARRLDGETRALPALPALHTIGHVARGFIVTLTRCPLGAGQPEAAVAATLEQAATAFCPPAAMVAANARTGLGSLVTVARALTERVERTEVLAPAFVDAASLLANLGEQLLGTGTTSPRSSAALGILVGADSEAMLTLSLRQQLFGRELLLDDHLEAGLLRMALVILLTLAGARLRALDEGRKQVLPHHLSFSHMLAKRTLHRPEPHGLLRANGPQAWPILDALPLLASCLGGQT